MTYAHDAHCNVIHEPGPEECPPHCEDEQHISGQPCPSCGSTVARCGATPTVQRDTRMRLMIPLPENQFDDPTHEELMHVAVEAAATMAATRDLHAVNVTFVQKIEQFRPDPNSTEVKLSRAAYFTAEAIAI